MRLFIAMQSHSDRSGPKARTYQNQVEFWRQQIKFERGQPASVASLGAMAQRAERTSLCWLVGHVVCCSSVPRCCYQQNLVSYWSFVID
jgi:hypothetical protein